jgi:hypothetical protein
VTPEQALELIPCLADLDAGMQATVRAVAGADARCREALERYEALEQLLARHAAPAPAATPAWIETLEALMLRQKTLEALLDREAHATSSIGASPDMARPSSLIRCPFCHEAIAPVASDWVACKACLARHHQECWSESPRCGTCGGAAFLPTRPPARLPWRQVAAAAAAIVLVSAPFFAVSSGRRKALADLLAAAADAQRPAAERRTLYEEALGRDPSLSEARAGLDALAREKAAEDAHARDLERARGETVSLLAKQDAEHAALLDREHKDARLAEEQRLEDERTKRAADLYALVDKGASGTEAMALMTEALALLPPRATPLRETIEARKLDVALALAKDAIQKKQPAVADYWLAEARRVAPAKREAELASLAGELDGMKNGFAEAEEGRALLARGELALGRARLQHAWFLGAPDAALGKDLKIAEGLCATRALALEAEAHELIDAGSFMKALAKAREAALYAASGDSVLEGLCERRIAADARRQAAELSRSGNPAQAIEVLDLATRALGESEPGSALRRERVGRARLQDDPVLTPYGLIYVPGTKVSAPFYAERTPVTNRAFKAFVDDHGYDRIELWEPSIGRRLDVFKDGCAAVCTHRAPMAWTAGGFAPEDAEKPVVGVSIYEARAYARWRAQNAGGNWRVPTRREWQTAAGWDPVAERLQKYPWGDDFDPARWTKWLAAAKDSPLGASSALGLVNPGVLAREWVDDGASHFTLEGADASVGEDAARTLARIDHEGLGTDNARSELLWVAGFRLVRSLD